MLDSADKVEELEDNLIKLNQANIAGNIHLYNLFLPLILKGKVKKVITISSGHGDLDFINNLEVENSALYAAYKAALNVIVAKYSAQYKKDGVLFVSISPGVVDVGNFDNGMFSVLDRRVVDVADTGSSYARADAGSDGLHGEDGDLCSGFQGPCARG